VFVAESQPVIDMLKETGRVAEIDSGTDVDTVYDRVKLVIAQIEGHPAPEAEEPAAEAEQAAAAPVELPADSKIVFVLGAPGKLAVTVVLGGAGAPYAVQFLTHRKAWLLQVLARAPSALALSKTTDGPTCPLVIYSARRWLQAPSWCVLVVAAL
jgi:hypothetical protein